MSERYVKQNVIGKGGFSKVYRAWDVRRQCFVAWKEGEDKTYMRREASLLKELRHPAFPKYYDYLEKNGKGILVMEYVEGANLEQLLKRRKCFNEKTCMKIALEIAGGLLYLHEKTETMIFRDLKPSNIMIMQDGSVKIIDVGCVCVEQEGEASSAGTRDYGAWEQFEAEQAIGTYSDVYALGKVMQAMIQENPRARKGGMFEVIKMCIWEERTRRLPDMRSLIRVMAAYEQFLKRRGAFHRWNWVKCNFVKKLAKKSVIYQKNVRKKVESS